MSYAFKFYADPYVRQGDRCDFYAGFPASAAMLAGEYDPMEGHTIGADMTATLSGAHGQSEVAIVLSRGGKVYGRSNSMPLSRFSTTDDNAIHVLTSTQELTADELADFVPATPFTEDNITVTSVDVDLRSGELLLSGSAESDGWWFFDFTLDYEYICGLRSFTNPIWIVDHETEYVWIDKIDFSVSGKNLLQDIVLLIGKGAIRDKLEERLERDVNAEIRDQLSVLDGQAATVSSVTITSTRVTIEVTLVSPDSVCPFAMSMRSPSTMRTRKRAEVARMRRIRDEVLACSTRGRAYADMVRTHRAELGQLLAVHPERAAACYAVIDQVVNEAGRKGVGELSASAESVAAVRKAIESLAPVASPALSRDLEAFHARLAGRGAITAGELLAD